MADESCAFPEGSGEASRTSRRWLDRATAERLLNGAPLETLGLDRSGVDADTAAEAARLVRLLRSLRTLAGDAGAAEAWRAGAGSAAGIRPGVTAPGPRPAELPGESAALAAFRQARDTGRVHDIGPACGTGRAHTDAPAGGGAYPGPQGSGPVRGRGPTVASVEIGAIQVGEQGARNRTAADAPPGTRHTDTPRRPVRFGLVAALAACMLGGVTVAAATTGILPSPFGGSRQPGPSASVSGAATPAHPGLPTAPSASGGDTGSPAPSTPEGGPTGGPARGGPPDGDLTRGGTGKPGGAEVSENWWGTMMNACRDYRGGHDLDHKTQQELEDAAHGSGHVAGFCDRLLGTADIGQIPGGDSGDTSENGDDASRPGGDQGDQPGDHGDSADPAPPTPEPTAASPAGEDTAQQLPETSEVTPAVTFSEPPTQ